jgi:hypothetical protein
MLRASGGGSFSTLSSELPFFEAIAGGTMPLHARRLPASRGIVVK